MTMRLQVLACAGMVLAVCAACGIQAGGTPIYPPSLYDQRVSTNDVSIYWKCKLQADAVEFEGVVQETKGERVKFMELELAGADGGGKYVTSATTTLGDIIVLEPSQIAPFALRLGPASGDLRFDLFYRYEVDSALGGDMRPHFRALDVCSPTQHRFQKSRSGQAP